MPARKCPHNTRIDVCRPVDAYRYRCVRYGRIIRTRLFLCPPPSTDVPRVAPIVHRRAEPVAPVEAPGGTRHWPGSREPSLDRVSRPPLRHCGTCAVPSQCHPGILRVRGGAHCVGGGWPGGSGQARFPAFSRTTDRSPCGATATGTHISHIHIYTYHTYIYVCMYGMCIYDCTSIFKCIHVKPHADAYLTPLYVYRLCTP